MAARIVAMLTALGVTLAPLRSVAEPRQGAEEAKEAKEAKKSGVANVGQLAPPRPIAPSKRR